MSKTSYIAAWIGAIALLLVCGALSLWTVRGIDASAAHNARTLRALALIESLEVDLADAESIQRGYLLTADERFVAPFAAAVAESHQKLGELHTYFHDNAAQLERLGQLAPLIAQSLDRFRDNIALRRQGRAESALASTISGLEDERHTLIRRALDVLESEEWRSHSEREAQFAQGLNLLILGISLTGLLGVAMASMAAFRLRRQGEATRRLAAFQQALLDSADASIISTTPTGYIDSFNDGAVRLLGYTAEEMVGLHTPALIHDAREVQARAQELSRELGRVVAADFEVFTIVASREGQTETREWTYIRKDGKRVPVQLSVSAVRDGRGELSGFIGVARDISQRRMAERDRAWEKERLALALAASGQSMWEINWQSGRVSLDRRWTAQGDDDLAPRPWTVKKLRRLIGTQEWDRVFASGIDAALGRSAEFRVEHEVRAKDGQWHWILSCGRVVERDARGWALRMVGTSADITARKQAELAAVAARDDAELANRAKDAFLATMSHEIRTPLGGMLGMLELLARSNLNHEQSDTLDTARESADNLLRILNDILDWSKIEAGKLNLAPQATSISRLVRASSDNYERLAAGKKLSWQTELDEDLASAHMVDPLRLSQVLNNLLSNAIKFTESGGITVRVQRLEHGAGQESLRISVTDTGVGIDASAQERLFRPYSQASADTARLYGGTGLGLAICRSLAEMMQAHLELTSTPGMGSCFAIVLRLPVAALEAGRFPLPAAPAARRFERNGEAPLALVVDDHPVNRKLMSLQLRALGLRVKTADDGVAALALWRTGRFALVISDLNMPKMDGYELARTIRRLEADEGHPRTPLLAWTANASPAEADRCRAMGMDELLVKPVKLARLTSVLASCLAQPADPADAMDQGAPTDAQALGGPLNQEALSRVGASLTEQNEILSDFLNETHADFSQLAAAVARQDHALSLQLAHRMKGAARMVGAQELAAACAAVENTHPVVVDAIGAALERLHAHLAPAPAPTAQSLETT